MNPEDKLSAALIQIESISNLLRGNQHEHYFTSHLIHIKCELKRQLTNLIHQSKIKE